MVGEILGGRYELMESIGQGSAATVYRAKDRRMNRLVAVKVLREVYSTERKNITRFQMEARAQSSLAHPNIVLVHDYGQSADNYYIVMEFIQGSDLGRYLKTRHILAVDEAVAIAHDVALGLGAAHKRQIVHRDVKPQNIMVNGAGLVKLTDFGSVSMYEDQSAERLTDPGMMVGAVHYIAPEQAQGEMVKPAADVYALGIVLYEMLTGKRPFDGGTPVSVALRHIEELPEPPRKHNPKIPPGLEALILHCLEKDPRDRYANGDDLAEALDNYEDEVDVGAATGRYEYGPRNVVPAGQGSGARPTLSKEANPGGSARGQGLLSRFGSGAGTQHQPAQRPLPPPELENVKERGDTAAPAQRKKPKVFVSHSHKNDEFTKRFVTDLRAAGIEVWVDMTNIQHGDFMTRISEALSTCEWLVLVLTPDALASPAVQHEVNAAINRVWHKRMKDFIPFMAHPCDPEAIPPMWDTFHRYDATENYKNALAGLLRALGVP